MINVKFIFSGIVISMLLQSCTEILEPVALSGGNEIRENGGGQEDFEIKLKSLTFKSARDANNAPYPRLFMQAGIGSAANILNEDEILAPNMPISPRGMEYLLGRGDELRYTQLNEFVKIATQFPEQSKENDYLLGVGDELTLIQLNQASRKRNILSRTSETDDNQIIQSNDISQLNENVLRTSSLVGTDGNILLLDLGSIEAENRSLKDVRTEVRNILIRNGLAPNFQLEISGFNSQKAFVTFPNSAPNSDSNIVHITNLPVTLKELVISYGLRSSSKDMTIVSLTRSGETFRMTAGQMFEKSFPRIVINNEDQIEIDKVEEGSRPTDAVVGSRGNILIPGIGSIKAENRSLREVQADVSRVIRKKGLTPNFQLEISGFNSRKFFLITERHGSTSIPLKSFDLDLKTAVLSNIPGQIYNVNSNEKVTIVEVTRQGRSYRMTLRDILKKADLDVFIQDGDTIELKDFEYKPSQVFALSGGNSAKVFPIDPAKRETLADVLFTENGPLSNVLAERSEVYLLRGRSPSVAYHLDIQDVSRILVAAKTELRPNDIVFVAERPIISFARFLAEISPLRLLLRDINDGNIP